MLIEFDFRLLNTLGVLAEELNNHAVTFATEAHSRATEAHSCLLYFMGMNAKSGHEWINKL